MSEQNRNNIILIGMPGVGKSSLGVILAKEIGYRFLDTDLLIQEREDCLLREIIAEKGIDGFLSIEEEVCRSIEAENAVIATGGSVVYGEQAMAHLRELGTVVYLELPYPEVAQRLSDLAGRGVVLRAGQDLEELYAERSPLYESYADITVEESGLNMEETLAAVLAALEPSI